MGFEKLGFYASAHNSFFPRAPLCSFCEYFLLGSANCKGLLYFWKQVKHGTRANSVLGAYKPQPCVN